jgi:hypothetical protein
VLFFFAVRIVSLLALLQIHSRVLLISPLFYFLESREPKEQLPSASLFLGLSEYSGRWCLFVDVVLSPQCAGEDFSSMHLE